MPEMVICPNCAGCSCAFCVSHGPFGLVPEGVDVEVTLVTGMKPALAPLKTRMMRTFADWLLSDGGDEECRLMLFQEIMRKREKWDDDDDDQ